MKKLMTIFGAFLTASIVLTSCGSDDPKENGTDAGELECECKEIDKEIKENQKEIDRLEWRGDKASEESREEIAELQMANIELRDEKGDLYEEMADLNNKRWTATEGEDDQKHWDEDYKDAKDEYVKENCKDD
jgi:chromosome segregation ATPase